MMQPAKPYFSGVYELLFLALVMAFSTTLPGQTSIENCANGQDDDGDGLTDLNDPDCACVLIEAVSLIPNPSFEELNCCPQNRSELYCADVWIQASEPTTDLIHDCGFPGWNGLLPPRPFPDGEGVLGFRDGRPGLQQSNIPEPSWKEYAGACLLSPMLAGETYRFEFDIGFINRSNSPDINISFYGATNCDNLPFGQGNEMFGCPTNGPGWSRLGSVQVPSVSQGGWRKEIIEVTPAENITAMVIGPDCIDRPRNIPLYYFFDNLLLADITTFTFVISETDHPCSPDHRLQLPFREGFSYQWYKEGVALAGETSFRLTDNYGVGNYQALLDDGTSCRQTENFEYTIPVITASPRQVICAGETYDFGDQTLDRSGNYANTFANVNGCDSIVRLDLLVLGDIADTVRAKIFPDESYPIGFLDLRAAGQYEVPFASSIGCDSLVYLDLSYYQIYRPTAFSPNADGMNDVFTIVGNDELVEVRDLRIYDRWGSLLAEGSPWDGTRAGTPLPPGLYVYTVIIVMDDGIERPLNGSVILLR
jgi:gliding motility-associated-like protein